MRKCFDDIFFFTHKSCFRSKKKFANLYKKKKKKVKMTLGMDLPDREVSPGWKGKCSIEISYLLGLFYFGYNRPSDTFIVTWWTIIYIDQSIHTFIRTFTLYTVTLHRKYLNSKGHNGTIHGTVLTPQHYSIINVSFSSNLK